MAITTDEAAKIAREAGLGLPDVVALSRLATTPEEARALAAQFSRPLQLSRESLKSMSADEIVSAREKGQLDDILGGPQS
jgi:hypothetical protein